MSFGKEGVYSAVTLPMPDGVGSAVFSVEAADASSTDLRTLSGPGFGYTILVTKSEGTPFASEPAPTTEAVGTPVTSEPAVPGGSKRKK